MNLAITATTARTWKAVKTHYLVAIAGVALAVSAVAGAASQSIDWGGSSGGSTSRAIPPAAVSPDQKYITFYLVASEAERERVIALEDEAQRIRYDNNTFEPDASFAVFVAQTPDEVSAAILSIYEASGYRSDAIVSVVDLLPADLKR